MSAIKTIFEKSIQIKQQLMQDNATIELIDELSDKIVAALKSGNKVLFCGNGGSAADAQHLAAEFSGRFYTDRDALPAEALHCNTSYLTAVGNDYGFEHVYSRIVKGIGKKGDVLIGITTSGNSINIVNAIEQANANGMLTIGFTGLGGGRVGSIAQHNIAVPSKDTPRIQECHILVGHIICQLVEERYFVIQSGL